jgi:hypothetical protein
MTMAATAKEYTYGKAPKKIVLKGDPSNPESAEHIIVFPGGSIAVCRTSDNNYWAHISVNREAVDGAGERQSKVGTIEVIRVDTIDGVKQVEPVETDHFAVLICTNPPIEGTKREKLNPGTQLTLL